MKDLPNFTAIKISQIENQLNTTLSSNLDTIQNLLAQPKPYTWDNLMQPLEEMSDQLDKWWSPIGHLNAVKNSDELRQSYNACLPMLSQYSTQIAHNHELYQAVRSLAEDTSYRRLDPAQQKILQNEIRDFKLSGVALPDDKKKRFAKLCEELAQLTNKFEENVLDATQGWTKLITDETELAGLSQAAKDAAQQRAQERDQQGWLFTLDIPSYSAIMTYADSAALREECYQAYTTRASDQGPNAGQWDNTQLMNDILARRLELAQILDFANYAEYSLATKMVKKTDEVMAFLHQLVTASRERAQQEFAELEQFARDEYGVEKLQAWDVGYYSEKLRQARYDISQEQLREYFPEHKVVSGLFAIVNKLFGVRVEKVEGVDTWHPDVTCYAIYDNDKQLRAYFYFDLYARENKRGGAWMDECRVRRKTHNGHHQIPSAFITCNLPRPVGDKPALFKHDDVVTLFHEFGHGLQHMLTTVDYADVSGINGIPWDAVEIASQFLENWAWEEESIAMISEHYQTGEPLPAELLQKMQRAKNFHAALYMLRQLEFALFDFTLHLEFDPNKDNQVQEIMARVRHDVSVVPTPEYNRFQNSFSHIFAGGYAAGYYSYKWAEVMASDAFSLFLEKGIFDPETSQKFLHTFLESGGVKEPMELFVEFRGRKPQVEALLQQCEIIPFEKGIE